MKNPFLAAICAASILLAGCAPQLRKARATARANRDFAAGKYEAAEIEYLNLLRIDHLNPHAIGRLGVIYFDQGREGKALGWLLEAKRLDPGDVEVRLKLGLYFLAAGRFQDAKEEAGFVLEKDPRNAEAPLLLAETALQPTEVAEARSRLEKLPGAGKSASIQVALATLDFRELQFSQAESRIRQALALDPKSSDAYTALAALHWAENQTSQAGRDFARAAEEAPAQPGRTLQYAAFEIQTGNHDAGRRMLEEEIHRDPGFLPAYILLAQLDEFERHYADSEALVTKVLQRDPGHPDALLALGRLDLDQNRADKANRELEAARTLYPHFPELEYELARARIAAGDDGKATDSLTRAVAWNPDYTDAVLLLAKIDIETGDPAAGRALIEPFLQRHPHSMPAGYLLAAAELAQDDPDDALALYRRLAEADPKDARPLYLEGVASLREGNKDDARQAFEKALVLDPDSTPALGQLVNLDVEAKRFGAARQRVEREMARKSSSAEPRVLLGRIDIASHDWAKAESALQDAIRLEPNSPDAYVLLAALYSDQHQEDKALARLRDAVARDPRDVKALMLTALIEDRHKDAAGAIRSYEQILAADPNFSPALNNLAYLYANSPEHIDRAVALAQKARKLLPHDPRVADTLGWVLCCKGSTSWALNLLRESAGELPDDPEIQFHLGMDCYALGLEQPARAALERALALNPSLPEAAQARDRLGLLDFDPAKAGPAQKAALEKAAAARPGDIVAQSRLAAVYEKEGDLARASALWEAALRADPGSEPAMVQVARIRAARGDTAGAMTLAQAAHEKAPEDAGAAAVLGGLAYQNRNYTWAVSLLRQAADASPGDEGVRFALARALYAAGNAPEAASAMSEVAGSGGPQAAQAREVVFLLGEAGHPAPADAPRARAALGRDPSSLPALMAMAAIDGAAGRPAEAAGLYRKALAADSDFSPARRALVLLMADGSAGGPQESGLAARALEAYPDDPQVGEACGIIAYRQGDYRRAADLLQEAAIQGASDARLDCYLGMAQCRLGEPEGRETLRRALGENLQPGLASQARTTLANVARSGTSGTLDSAK